MFREPTPFFLRLSSDRATILLSTRKSRDAGFRVTVTREDLRRVRERGKRDKERKENKVKNRVELGVAARETINKTIINFPIYF